jgi:hypothetical protein
MQSYTIMLTPEKKFYEKIEQAKEYVYHKFGNQKYLQDEPHLTLYIAPAEDLKKVEEIVGEIAKKTKKMPVQVQEDYQDFPNDKLAGGGTSLGVKFDDSSNRKIQILQKEIVDGLNHLRKNNIHKRFKGIILPQNMMESVENYGYPFVNGEDKVPILIPHVNFCTFNPPGNLILFMKDNPPEDFAGPMNFDRISLYKLNEDDSIELIKHFQLQ